jgi:thiol-disulfide isomerase/thioredoxin
MKKTLLVLLSIIYLSNIPGYSQNRSISFNEKPWLELLNMAKDQKKMIFLDGYATWCGPCKWMAANMFTRDTIADLYNKTFICAHYDMEKGEGLQLAQTYQVKAYPSLLFISADGELVHKRVGAPQKVQDYFDMANVAMTPGEGFTAYVKKFQEGNRDPKFILKYMERLQEAYMPITDPLNQYFATVKEPDLTSRVNWDMMYLYLNDMDSREFKYLLKHQQEFGKLYTKDSVNTKIFNVYVQSMTALTRTRGFTEESYNNLKQKIRDSGYPDAEKVIFTSDLTIARSDKFYDLAYNGIDKYYSDDYAILSQAANAFLKGPDDRKFLERGAEWAKKAMTLKNTAEINDIYAGLMFRLGNKKVAVEYEQKAIELGHKEKISTKEMEASLKKFQEQ